MLRGLSGRLFFLLLLLAASMRPAAGETIQLERNQHGTYIISVQINGALVLPFVLDTGASLVVIPEDVFRTLTRTGTVTKNDFIGTGTAMLADGSEHASDSYVLHEVRVGDHIVRNVVASVVPVNGAALLGQSFLSKLPAWSIDNTRQALVIAGGAGATQSAPAAPTTTPVSPAFKPIRCNRLGRGYRQTRLEFESGHTSTRCRGGTRRVWCCGLQSDCQYRSGNVLRFGGN